MISIVDCGIGNLRSITKAMEKMGFSVIVTRDPSMIEKSDGIVLPGVGAFDAAMKDLKETKIDQILRNFSQPILGICLGLQMLFQKSEEGRLPGLGLISGEVKRFEFRISNFEFRPKVPQMGWNQLKIKQSSPILKDIPDDCWMYFVHSYYVIPENSKVVSATTDYGIEFASVVSKDNLFGTQFHPEKSGDLGLKILKNFGELCLK